MLSSKNIRHILKKKQEEQVRLFSWDYIINRNENGDENDNISNRCNI